MNHDPMAFDDLAARWRHRACYTVLDLRSDVRQAFLHAWRAWRADAPHLRCATLHFVAVVSDWENDPRDGGVSRIVDRPTHAVSRIDHDATAAIHNDADNRSDTAPSIVAGTDPGIRNDIGADIDRRDPPSEDVQTLIAALDAAWPARVAGLHRLEFDEGRVVLTLAFSSVSDALAEVWLRADEMRIDASTIDRPDATTAIAKGLARLAGPQSRLFLESISLDADKTFRNSGFVIDDETVLSLDVAESEHAEDTSSIAGTAGTTGTRAATSASAHPRVSTSPIRTMVFAPRWRVRRHEPPAPQLDIAGYVHSTHAEATQNTSDSPADIVTATSEKPLDRSRQDEHHDVLIIGAGLAGCALAQRLGARGLRLAMIDAAPNIATGASGNPAGVFHPVVASDDSLASRATRAGFLYALGHWRTLERHGFSFDWSSRGLVQVAVDEDEQSAFESAIDAFDLPRDLVRYVDRDAAHTFLGVKPAFGGLLFEHGGFVDPASLCRAQLHAARASTSLDLMINRTVASLDDAGDEWRALDENGRCIARAPIVVVSNSNDASRLASLDYAPTRAIRGQLTWIDDPILAALTHPLIGDGYLLPRLREDTRQLTGASYELDDEDIALRESSQLDNLARLQRLVPNAATSLATHASTMPLTGRVALRCATSDRMPMIGQLADESAARTHASTLSGAWPLDLPRRAGLYGAYGYGSRGLIWAALGAEIIASQITGAPLPVPRSLADAFDPARFLMRALRQREVQ